MVYKIKHYLASSLVLLLITNTLYANDYKALVSESLSLIESNPQKAKKIANKAIDAKPDKGDAYIIKGLIYYISEEDAVKSGVEIRRGMELIENTEERNMYIAIIEKMTSTYKSKEEFELYQKAYQAIEENQSEEAISMLNEAASLNKINYKLQYELGYAYIEMKKYKKAIFHLENGRIINPVSIKILNELKYCYSEIGDIYKLQSILIDIIKYFGERPNLYHELGFAYLRNDNIRLAKLTLETNIKKYPKYFLSYYTLGQLYYKENNCSKSKPLIESFIKQGTKEAFKKANVKVDVKSIMTEAKVMLEKCAEPN